MFFRPKCTVNVSPEEAIKETAPTTPRQCYESQNEQTEPQSPSTPTNVFEISLHDQSFNQAKYHIHRMETKQFQNRRRDDQSDTENVTIS